MLKKILIILVISVNLFANDGEEIFKSNCKSCHIMKMGWQIKNKSTLKAPPIFGVVKQIKGVFPKEKQFVEFVVGYLEKPTKIKARCKEDAVEQFGLMPKSVGEGLSKKEKKEVASWLFKNIIK